MTPSNVLKRFESKKDPLSDDISKNGLNVQCYADDCQIDDFVSVINLDNLITCLDSHEHQQTYVK